MVEERDYLVFDLTVFLGVAVLGVAGFVTFGAAFFTATGFAAFFAVERAQAKWIQLMRESGIRPHLVHACERTGMIVTETNRHLFTDDELDRWEAAVQDYHDKKASGSLDAENRL